MRKVSAARCSCLGLTEYTTMKHIWTLITKITSSLLFAMVPFTLYAQQDSIKTNLNDSIMLKLSTLKAIEIKAPKPIYSMDAGIVNYNVAIDETIKGGTALDALRNAPSVEVGVDGNVKLRGSTKVELWINGYPTHLNGENMQIYLTSLSSEVIDHIEVIKNPSAEYMIAEGTAIINIVTNVKLRRNQFAAIGLSGSNRPYASPWGSYVYDGDKLDFNVYLAPSLSHHNISSQGSSWSFKDNAAGDMDTTQSQRWNTTDSSSDYYTLLNIGLIYKIDSINDISFNSFSLIQGFSSQSIDDRYRTEYLPTFLPLHYITDKEHGSLNANGFATLTYSHKFVDAGHNLSFTVNTDWQYAATEATTNRRFDSYYGNELRKTVFHGGNIAPSFSLRYRKPLGKHDNISISVGFAPGIKQAFDSGMYFDSSSMTYAITDSLRTSRVTTCDKEEYMSLNWRHKTNVFSTTLGVVAEAHQIGYNVQSIFPEALTLNYMSLRPTFNFTCHTRRMHYFSVNYSFFSKNPSPAQLSQSPAYQYDSYKVGNPQLDPYCTHKADISWNKYFASGSSVSVETYGEWNNNSIESVLDATSLPDPYLGHIVPFTTYYNIGSSYKYGLESNATYRVNAFLRFGLNANMYYSAYTIDHPKTGLYSDSALTYDLSLNCNAKLFNKVYLNLSGNYTSPTINPFAEKRSNYTIDLSASADFLDNRLAARISISDLFNWQRTDILNINPYYISTEIVHRDSRYITLGITYRIGKMDLQYKARSGAGIE